MPPIKKIRNFQEEFSLEDIEIAQEVKNTYYCGLSRIALKAPNQTFRSRGTLFQKPESDSASITYRTLKLQYAIQVWNKATLLSIKDHGDLSYYWWLGWEDRGEPFKKIEYYEFRSNITIEQTLTLFWKLLEDIANSGEVSVTEGFWMTSRKEEYERNPKMVCEIVLNKELAADIKIDDAYSYNYNRTPVSYTWQEIKDFFCELTLDQLRLTMPEELHKHTSLDNRLLQACGDLDLEAVKSAIAKGADVNCLSEQGHSPMQEAVDYFCFHNIDKHYTNEEHDDSTNRNFLVCREILDVLLEHGADVNLFGYDSDPILECGYHNHNVDIIKYLLEKGAHTNDKNTIAEDLDYEYVRCTVLHMIDRDLLEDYDDIEEEIEKLVREAGGRQYVWDYDPWNKKTIGKYVVVMDPSTTDNHLFADNARWWIGTTDSLTIEDKAANQSVINLSQVAGLKQWVKDFQDHIRCDNGFDWKAWKEQGFNLAKQVAALLPNSVALFYLHDNEKIIEYSYYLRRRCLCYDGDIIRVK